MKRSPALLWFVAGLGVGVVLLLLVWLFLSYQQPELLLQFVNLRYCG